MKTVIATLAVFAFLLATATPPANAWGWKVLRGILNPTTMGDGTITAYCRSIDDGDAGLGVFLRERAGC